MSEPPEDILALALSRGVTNPPGKSHLHGEVHWKCVALAGLAIARLTPGADGVFIYTFAQLHDTCRLHDSGPGEGADEEHGARAAALFMGMVESPGVETFLPYEPRTEDMVRALAGHVGTPRADPADINIGICWDADRVNLWRVGIEPDPAYLSTPVGSSPYLRQLGFELCRRQHASAPFPSWAAIRRLFEMLRLP